MERGHVHIHAHMFCASLCTHPLICSWPATPSTPPLAPTILQVLKAILPGERVVILCERGKELTSEGLADLLRKAGEDNTPLTFCIGGPFGHSDAVSMDRHRCFGQVVRAAAHVARQACEELHNQVAADEWSSSNHDPSPLHSCTTRRQV